MIISLLISAFLSVSNVDSPAVSASYNTVATDSIHWTTIEAVDKTVSKHIKKNKVKDERLIMVDFYTDWCGWCKRLDNETYMDAEVIALTNKYFHAIKFDAEQKDSVEFAGKMYKMVATGKRGTHDFAMEMGSRPGGRIGYPTISFIDPMGKKIAVEAGFKDAAKMKLTLIYYGEGHYKTKDFITFQKEYNQSQLTD